MPAKTTKRRKKRTAATVPAHPQPVPVLDPEVDEIVPDTIEGAETARPSGVQATVINLAAGDLDASWQGVESGEEAVGGSTPTPDQDNVDQIGSALGIVEQDEKPLATTEKVEGRDRERWELDPASAEDFAEHERDQARDVANARRRHRRTSSR